MKPKNDYVVIQARTNSKRYPNKIMANIVGFPMLHKVYHQCKLATDDIIIAIPESDPCKKWVQENNYLYYEGSEFDVLDRYYQTAKAYNLDAIIRITGDCPFIDPAIICYSLRLFRKSKLDFITNTPCVNGQDVEIISYRLLKFVWETATKQFDREHVTSYIKKNSDQLNNLGFSYAVILGNYNNLWFPKMSIDTKLDLEWAKSHEKYLSERKANIVNLYQNPGGEYENLKRTI